MAVFQHSRFSLFLKDPLIQIVYYGDHKALLHTTCTSHSCGVMILEQTSIGANDHNGVANLKPRAMVRRINVDYLDRR